MVSAPELYLLEMYKFKILLRRYDVYDLIAMKSPESNRTEWMFKSLDWWVRRKNDGTEVTALPSYFLSLIMLKMSLMSPMIPMFRTVICCSVSRCSDSGHNTLCQGAEEIF